MITAETPGRRVTEGTDGTPASIAIATSPRGWRAEEAEVTRTSPLPTRKVQDTLQPLIRFGATHLSHRSSLLSLRANLGKTGSPSIRVDARFPCVSPRLDASPVTSVNLFSFNGRHFFLRRTKSESRPRHRMVSPLWPPFPLCSPVLTLVFSVSLWLCGEQQSYPDQSRPTAVGARALR